jgi:hypothetical protein
LWHVPRCRKVRNVFVYKYLRRLRQVIYHSLFSHTQRVDLIRREGMSHLNKVGPQESSIMTKHPATWRAACKTVVGADNQEGTSLRIRVHPQTSRMEDELLHP